MISRLLATARVYDSGSTVLSVKFPCLRLKDAHHPFVTIALCSLLLATTCWTSAIMSHLEWAWLTAAHPIGGYSHMISWCTVILIKCADVKNCIGHQSCTCARSVECNCHKSKKTVWNLLSSQVTEPQRCKKGEALWIGLCTLLSCHTNTSLEATIYSRTDIFSDRRLQKS